MTTIKEMLKCRCQEEVCHSDTVPSQFMVRDYQFTGDKSDLMSVSIAGKHR